MSASIFPSQNTWITPRTNSGKLTDQNCEIVLNQKISKINQVLMYLPDISIAALEYTVSTTGQVRTAYNVKLSQLFENSSKENNLEVLDITKYVVERAKYNTLLKYNAGQTIPWGEVMLNNAWYYEHNAKSIVLVNTRANLFGGFVGENIFHFALVDIATKNGGLWLVTPNNEGSVSINALKSSLVSGGDYDIMSAQFRVFYTPLGESVKLNVPKTNPQLNQFCIPYSQQQPIVDNVSHGREMQSRSNRTGCEKKEVVRVLHSIKDVRHPRKGYYYREKDEQGNLTGNVWRLTECRIQIYCSTIIRVIETWSKNWTMESDNVPINREFRSWNIPADIVQRNLTWNDYCLITRKVVDLPDTALFSDQAKVELLRGLESSVNPLATECTNLWFYTKGADNSEHGAVMNCSAFGFGNSLVFSGKTKDNLSAGVQRVPSDNKDDNYQFCKDVYYCNEDGTLEKMYIQVGSALYNANATGDADTQASYRYPEYVKTTAEVYNAPDYPMPPQGITLLKEKEFLILKDPSEQLNFTYQLHLMTDNPYLVIGSTWAATNPLTQRRTEAPTIKVWKLTKPLPQGAQVMTGDYGSVDTTPNLFVVNGSAEQPYVQFAEHDGAGICVTDEYNNVLIAYIGNDLAQFNLFFTHDYRSMAIMLKAGA